MLFSELKFERYRGFGIWGNVKVKRWAVRRLGVNKLSVYELVDGTYGVTWEEHGRFKCVGSQVDVLDVQAILFHLFGVSGDHEP